MKVKYTKRILMFVFLSSFAPTSDFKLPLPTLCLFIVFQIAVSTWVQGATKKPLPGAKGPFTTKEKNEMRTKTLFPKRYTCYYHTAVNSKCSQWYLIFKILLFIS